jgi:catechol 2,3-dioxygenase
MLPDSLRLGPVHLTVTDVDRSVGFYQDAIGLQLHAPELRGARAARCSG